MLIVLIVCVSCLRSECHEQLDFKDTELQMLVVSLKELTATKEVIQTLEQLLCDDTSQLEEERSQVHPKLLEPQSGQVIHVISSHVTKWKLILPTESHLQIAY